MSYLVQPQARPARRRRMGLWAAAVLLVLVAATSVVISRTPDPVAPAPVRPPASLPAPPGPSDGGGLTWSRVGVDPVPVSAQHGPFQQYGGVARGFSHDGLGAAVAAIHISARLTSSVGAGIYRKVLSEQTLGDLPGQRELLEGQSSTVKRTETRVQQWWWGVTAGDPRGEWVRVALAARTGESMRLGGYAWTERTLRWRDGDWRVEVPVKRPVIMPDTAGLQLLGGPA